MTTTNFVVGLIAGVILIMLSSTIASTTGVSVAA
jgi:hypothetical protein